MMRSVGKSITALLLGMAKDSGHIAAVSDPVSHYWLETGKAPLGAATLEHLLTMRAGLAADDDDAASPGHEDRMDAADDPLAFVAALPRADPPGQRYRYNSATAYAAGVVVAKASGRSLAQFADSRLFAPLGITRWRWEADRAGYTKGQGNLWITARGLAAIGEMVRRKGRYRGKQIISGDWIPAVLAPAVDIAAVDPYADSYGYFWYGNVSQSATAWPMCILHREMAEIKSMSSPTKAGDRHHIGRLWARAWTAALRAILKPILAADISAAPPRR
ncbi:serine hydrolase domain-containing protein [Sphingopyxis sp. MWB1]|uniref:serine hydrolase domain-containing protein n=1 Tax=Sphingopyxis sp. MWB1 TaxID=1537715 RepID=UPI00190F11E7|nr:serine hydrolase domain-containing protein [Sphingopyxis sp. MWB1]